MDELLLWHGGYWQEGPQLRFLDWYLKPGMTVLDVGAHHGLYTLLASKRVGWRGRVIAFEPSPRERRRLRQHVWLNLCVNTKVEEYALGEATSVAQFFVVEDHAQDWCNSLRPPLVQAATRTISVKVLPLDHYIETHSVGHVDLIKLDVEGAELSALRGATGALQRYSPVLMVEVEDKRTKPWGYAAREIVTTLDRLGYEWFEPQADGDLRQIPPERGGFEANLIAIPKGRLEESFSRIR